MIIGITEPEKFSSGAIKILKEIGSVELYNKKSDFKDFISNKDVLFVRLKRFWGEDILKDTNIVKYICSPTTGLNHIDIEYMERRNIKIVSLRNEVKFLNTIRATPEHTLGLIIALLRNYSCAFLSEINKEWDRDRYRGYELYGRDVGIIGFGRVGKIIAKYLKALGSNIYYYDTNPKIKPVWGTTRISSLDKLISICSIVILTASYSKKYKRFINKKYIDLLKGKYFINTSRGELVDEEYLIEKIRNGYLKGVALDVLANENVNNNLDNFIVLTKNSNLIITPHIAGCTYESMNKTEEFLALKLIKICREKN